MPALDETIQQIASEFTSFTRRSEATINEQRTEIDDLRARVEEHEARAGTPRKTGGRGPE